MIVCNILCKERLLVYMIVCNILCKKKTLSLHDCV